MIGAQRLRAHGERALEPRERLARAAELEEGLVEGDQIVDRERVGGAPRAGEELAAPTVELPRLALASREEERGRALGHEPVRGHAPRPIPELPGQVAIAAGR